MAFEFDSASHKCAKRTIKIADMVRRTVGVSVMICTFSCCIMLPNGNNLKESHTELIACKYPPKQLHFLMTRTRTSNQLGIKGLPQFSVGLLAEYVSEVEQCRINIREMGANNVRTNGNEHVRNYELSEMSYWASILEFIKKSRRQSDSGIIKRMVRGNSCGVYCATLLL